MADELNFQVAAEGFGSYLDGILPADIAISAGAFSASMQQIRNILNVDIEKFAQVVYSTEVVNTGLNLVNGSDIPTNLSEAQQGYEITALGSGPYGTYTASDFFGCMSGLPYSWSDIFNGILNLQTIRLKNIYRELFLATEWEGATASVTYTTGSEPDPDNPGKYKWYWQITGISINDRGGGYGRGGAPAPAVTITGGSLATATTTIGTNDLLAGSNGNGFFGRVTDITLTYTGTKVYYSSNETSSTPGPVPSPPAVQIQCPPVTAPGTIGNTLPTGYTNSSFGTTGWPTTMGNILYGSSTSYINQANDEIANIRTLNPYISRNLNTVYNAAGTQLKIEQRARFTGIAPVATPRDDFTNIYPTALSIFVDSIPYLAQDTRPHMYAQTLEAISNINTVGGQSIIAMMRQERNAARLQEIGIELDNNIPGEYDPEIAKLIISNGTAPVGLEGIDIDGINGNVENPTTTFTSPSNLLIQSTDGNLISPKPIGYYDPNTLQLKATPNTSTVGQFSPLQQLLNLQNNNLNNVNLLGPSGNGTGPAAPLPNPVNSSTLSNLPNRQNLNNASNLNGVLVSPNSVNPKPNQIPLNLQTGVNNLGPSTGPGGAPVLLGSGITNPIPSLNLVDERTGAPSTQLSLVNPLARLGIFVDDAPGTITQPITPTQPILILTAGPQLPLGIGTPVDNGKPATPGSLAGSKATNLLPPNLNAGFIASTLTPSTLSVQEAIDDVIRCNCDCWVD